MLTKNSPTYDVNLPSLEARVVVFYVQFLSYDSRFEKLYVLCKQAVLANSITYVGKFQVIRTPFQKLNSGK